MPFFWESRHLERLISIFWKLKKPCSQFSADGERLPSAACVWLDSRRSWFWAMETVLCAAVQQNDKNIHCRMGRDSHKIIPSSNGLCLLSGKSFGIRFEMGPGLEISKRGRIISGERIPDIENSFLFFSFSQRYNLYIDNMPTDEVPPIPEERIRRILTGALNVQRVATRNPDTSLFFSPSLSFFPKKKTKQAPCCTKFQPNILERSTRLFST